jgi:hypothetical protein
LSDTAGGEGWFPEKHTLTCKLDSQHGPRLAKADI